MHPAGLSVRCSSDELDARLHQSQALQLWAFAGNALPLQATERHVTVGWCQEVSRNVLASRHLAVAGTDVSEIHLLCSMAIVIIGFSGFCNFYQDRICHFEQNCGEVCHRSSASKLLFAAASSSSLRIFFFKWIAQIWRLRLEGLYDSCWDSATPNMWCVSDHPPIYQEFHRCCVHK